MIRRNILRVVDHPYFVPVCLALAVLSRVLWISLIHAPQIYDWLWYYQRAVDIVSGRGYTVNGIPTAYWPVGYPAFLSELFYLFGPHESVGKIANIAEWFGTILLTYYFVGKIFKSERAARLTVLILSLHPNAIAYTSLLTADMFLAFLLVLAAVLFISANGHWPFWICSGLVWGFAVLTKPQSIVVPLIFLMMFGVARVSAWKVAAVTYLLIFAVLAPWIYRNSRALGSPVLSTNGGVTLMIGNNPYSTGRDLWSDPVRMLLGDLGADQDHMFDGREVARDARARQVAVQFMLHHPVRVALLWPKKLVALYRSDVEGLYFTLGLMDGLETKMREFYSALRVIGELYYIGMILLFVASLPVVLRSGTPVYYIGLAICLYFTLVYMVFIGDPRYHFALIPWIAMYSGIGATVLLGGRKAFVETTPSFSPQPVEPV